VLLPCCCRVVAVLWPIHGLLINFLVRVSLPRWDPRSPTVNIARTPVAGGQAPLGFDPRSPTVNLARTPVPKALAEIPMAAKMTAVRNLTPNRSTSLGGGGCDLTGCGASCGRGGPSMADSGTPVSIVVSSSSSARPAWVVRRGGGRVGRAIALPRRASPLAQLPFSRCWRPPASAPLRAPPR
jgi:hypothetical protein